jgi:hypothetical protein
LVYEPTKRVAHLAQHFLSKAMELERFPHLPPSSTPRFPEWYLSVLRQSCN